jgi:hypothetical protein
VPEDWPSELAQLAATCRPVTTLGVTRLHGPTLLADGRERLALEVAEVEDQQLASHPPARRRQMKLVRAAGRDPQTPGAATDDVHDDVVSSRVAIASASLLCSN